MTPRQQLVAHLATQHGEHIHRGTHQQLIVRHKNLHKAHLTHSHRPDGWTLGGDQIRFRIFLSPPRNPNSTKNEDRNWILNVANDFTGWRRPLPATWAGNITGAKCAADKLLGYQANWVAVGWGWKVEAIPPPDDDFKAEMQQW
jgi:hypothetical protein